MTTSKTFEATIEAVQQPRKKIPLSSIATKPKLIPLVLDSDETVAEYGGELEFFVKDRYPVAQFMEMMKVGETARDNEESKFKLIEMTLPMMLNEDGKPLLDDEHEINPVVALEAVHKVLEYLGNLSARNLTGTHQK